MYEMNLRNVSYYMISYIPSVSRADISIISETQVAEIGIFGDLISYKCPPLK